MYVVLCRAKDYIRKRTCGTTVVGCYVLSYVVPVVVVSRFMFASFQYYCTTRLSGEVAGFTPWEQRARGIIIRYREHDY